MKPEGYPLPWHDELDTPYWKLNARLCLISAAWRDFQKNKNMNELIPHIDDALAHKQTAMTFHIITCPSSDTMPLSRLLAPYGAWIPTEHRHRRATRQRKAHKQEVAALPGYIYIPADIALPDIPGKTFQKWHRDCKPVTVTAKELDRMRSCQNRPVPRDKLPEVGAWVACNVAGFQGLRGRISHCSRRQATVVFESLPPVKVPVGLVEVVDG